jgi:UDP-N-acetylmuramate--alanine ligase
LLDIFDQFKKQTKKKFINLNKLNYSSHNVPKNNLIGAHNETNVRNAVYFSKKMNIAEKTINEAVFKFQGIERRLQKLGNFRGMDVYDDYAHSPMKINASINAIYDCYPEHNVILLWRPHGYSTLNEHFSDYTDLFNKFIRKKNNLLILMPVYYAGGTVNIIKTTEDLIKNLNNTHDSSKLLTTFNDIYLYLCKIADSKKVLLGMGARDPDLPLFLRRIVK